MTPAAFIGASAILAIAAAGVAWPVSRMLLQQPIGWMPVAIVAAGLVPLGWSFMRLTSDARRERASADALRRANADLGVQVTSRATDLRDSNERLRSIIDSAVDAILVIDAKGHIEAFNPAAERLFGYAASEVAGRNVNMLMPAPYHEEHDGYLDRYLASGIPKIIGIGREVTARRRDGTLFPVHLSVGEMAVGAERKFTGILHDLTTRVRLEEQMREQAALVKLGEMAAVIAHEVRNPLAGVRGALQVIGPQLPAGSSAAPMINEIVARLDALNDLMKDLLLFARPPKPRPAPTQIVPLVAVTAHLLKQDPSLHDVQVEVHGVSPPVAADAELLKIAFHNLLVNSAHAMNGKGTIRVAVDAGDSQCRIAFIDSGPGIPADVRDKIFTPFFTTKPRGSGLGLPTAKRLIEAHHGRIVVECPPAGGTTVTVQIPTLRR